MLTVLGGLADFERKLIHARTDEGCKRAKGRASFGDRRNSPRISGAMRWKI